MPQTLALYDKDPYLDHFSAPVLSCTEDGEGRFRVILAATCFFPEQGGQTADTGFLNGTVRVLDARISHGVIEHITDGPLLPGTAASGKIDFARRFSHMQQHTGEHIFSGLVHALTGYQNVGFHLSDRTVTMDYSGELTASQLEALEDEANRVVCRDLPVLISYPDAEQQRRISYRSKKEVEGPLRLVTIPGVDVCACCAPHVRHTGEIGIIRVMNAIRYKGGTRLNILCGKRALEAARAEKRVLTELGRLFSCEPEGLPAQAAALQEREKAALQKLHAFQTEALLARADEVSSVAVHPVLDAGDVPEKAASAAADRLAVCHPGVCAVCFGPEDARRVILVSGLVPLRPVAEAMRRELGFKGGGDDQCVRGKLPLPACELARWLNEHAGE